MIEININDVSFSHQDSSIPGKCNKSIKWIRDNSSINNIKFYTNQNIINNTIDKNLINFAWIMEPNSILPYIYDSIQSYYEKYDFILTHNSYILNNFKNAKYCPSSGIWVGGDYGGGNIKKYKKTKKCSIVSSNKKMCKLHIERADLCNLIKSLNIKDIDVYGTVIGEWVKIIDTLSDYMFSIVIENDIDDDFFTEKILNCFATYTIPIYLGARNISKYFNIDGIIQINKPYDIFEIIPSLNEDYYNSKLNYVEDNFNRCKLWEFPEDYIYNNYIKQISDFRFNP